MFLNLSNNPVNNVSSPSSISMLGPHRDTYRLTTYAVYHKCLPFLQRSVPDKILCYILVTNREPVWAELYYLLIFIFLVRNEGKFLPL